MTSKKYQKTTPSRILCWAKKVEAFECLSTDGGLASAWIPTQILFHVVCNHWLTLIDYLKSRLNHIQLEIESPDDFIDYSTAMTERQSRLCALHRMLLTFREMIQDMGSFHYMALDHADDGGACRSGCDFGVEPRRDSEECHRCMFECKNPYQSDISKLCDLMAEYSGQVYRLMKANQVNGSVQRSLARPDNSHRITLIVWLCTLYSMGCLVAQVLGDTTHPISELVLALKVWAAIGVSLMLILMLGLRFYAA